MGISVTNNSAIGRIQPDYGLVQKKNIRFTSSNLPADFFEAKSLNVYTTEYNLTKAINENPKIKSILEEINIPCSLNMNTVKDLESGHAADTQKIASGIIDNLPISLKNKTDRAAVGKAAFLHDTGKALIPEKILYKEGKLDEKETEIMHKHSELSYELLKNSGLDKKTLNLIKNHHQNVKKTGYPFVDNTFFADINQQIVSIADKYSALTEKRAYKESMTPEQALTVIAKDVQDGKFNRLVFNALVKFSLAENGVVYQQV